MSFFYDLNKKLDGIRATPEVTHQQLNERDMGKHNNATTGFKALAKKAGGGEKGDKIAGAQFQKMKKAGQLEEEGMSRAAKGYEKYGREGMEALAKAGRDGKALDPVRKKYDKYDNNDKVNEMWGDPYHDDAKVDAINAANPPKASGTGMKPATPVKHHTYDRKAVASNISGEESAKYDYRGQVEEKIETFRSNNGGKMVNTVKQGKGPFPTSQDTRDSYAKDVRAARAAGALQKDSSGQRSGVAPSGRKIEIDNFEEGMMDTVKSVGKRVASGVNRLVGHGSDEDMRKDVQRKAGVPQTGKKPEQRGMSEAADPLDFDKVLDAIAALYGDDIWDNDAMQDLANELEQAGPTDRELDFIIAKGRLPKRLAGIQFSAGDSVQFGESGAPMTAKQKSFAKLAPPANKITFADKIAGAKKEVDEMLGDVAAEAMRKALGGGKGRNAEMDEEKSKGTAFDMSTPRAAAPKVGSIERGHKHDIKHTATGRMVTRRVDDQGNSVGADDDSAASGEKRGRGRPKGTKGAIGAKGPSGKSKLMTREGDNESSELKAAMMLLKKSGYKVTKAESTDTGDDHAERAGKKVTKDIEYDEKKKDGITGKKRGPEDDKAEKSGKKVTKDIEHDEKKEKEVDESTTSGSVATSTAKKSSGGSMVGKGIYDSMNRELENMIAESMSINMSDSTEGGKSLTITATDEDALKLGMMLKNAGLGGGDAHGGDMHSPGEEPCETCGMPDCGCDDVEQAVDENAPDYPTNTEQADNNFGYAGGLDGPKSTGQSTVPVLASQDDRQHSYAAEEEDAIKRMMEMAGIKQAELKPWEQTMKEDAAEDATNAENDAEDAEAETEVQEDFLESIQRMREIAGIKEAKRPDFPDLDKDGDEKEPMSKAIKDKEEKKVDESIFALTNQWKAYKG